MSSSAAGLSPEAQRGNAIQFVGMLILVAVLLRTIFTVPVEFGGDAIKKWTFSLAIADGAPLATILHDHHTARWAINIPTSMAVELIGSNWFVYYLVPIMYFGLFLVVSSIIIYKANPTNIVLTLLIFMIMIFGDPMYFRSTSQLQPFIFVALYISLHAVFVARIAEQPSQINCFLAALCIFLAYGAKETAVFYVPATMIFIVLTLGIRRGAIALACIAGYGLFLLALETTFFSVSVGRFSTRLDFANVHFSRLDANLNSAFGVVGFETLFKRWTELPLYTTALFLIALCATIYLLAKGFRDRAYTIAVYPGLLFLSFAVLATFAVKSISPLVPLEPPKPKYLADLVPWACLATAIAAGQVWSTLRSAAVRHGFARATLLVAALLCAASLLTPRQWDGRYPSASAWMWRADESYAFAKDLVLRGVPVSTPSRTTIEMILSTPLVALARDDTGRVSVAPPFRNDFADENEPVHCITIRSELKLRRCLAARERSMEPVEHE